MLLLVIFFVECAVQDGQGSEGSGEQSEQVEATESKDGSGESKDTKVGWLEGLCSWLPLVFWLCACLQ